MADLIGAAELLARHGVYLFFLHDGHFLNPLVPAELRRMQSGSVAADPDVASLVDDVLVSSIPSLAPGIYFPAALARAVAEGEQREIALRRFHYDLIRVDSDQMWHFRGEEVAVRTRRFFEQHLAFEPALDTYMFEYRVHEGWWDKSYLDAEITPMLGRQVAEAGDGRLSIALNNGREDLVDAGTFRLDDRERLFCRSLCHGEVLVASQDRFALLKGLSDDCLSIRIGGRSVPLRWPNA